MKSFLGAQLAGLSTISILVFITPLVVLTSNNPCQAYFPANESTYLNFHIPTDLRHNQSWPHAASVFGRLGHGPEGSLVLPVKMFGDTQNNNYLCNDNFDFDTVNKRLKIPQDSGAPFILLVERGMCTFVKKVRSAQHLGAAAVLIADTKNEHLPAINMNMITGSGENGYYESKSGDILNLDRDHPDDHPPHDRDNHTAHENAFRLADDGSGRDISIPSMMIAKNEYLAIKKVIDSKPNSTGILLAEISWHVPKFVYKVTMDLWHSPIDTHSKRFLASNFSVIARTFDLNEMHGNTHDNESYNDNMNLLRFKERPVLLDGVALGCLGNTDAPDEACYRLCTNGGRYCHVSHRRTDGKDIVTESLRRLCIDQHYKSPKFYWDYIDHFSNFCWDADYFANEKCVEDAYKHSNIDKEVINSCFEDSGSPEKDTENVLLKDALIMQRKSGIHKSPSVKINHEINQVVEWLGLNPQSVLRGLCDAFELGQKPHVCYACMQCGDPVACAQRSPMKCLSTDGAEKEDPNAHKQENHHHKKNHWGRFLFGTMLLGGCAVGYVYYKKMEQEGGLGSYSLQDAFLSDSA